MTCRNFICYRGGSAGEVFGSQLFSHLKEFENIFGKTYYSNGCEEDSSFLYDIPSLMESCENFIVMLTPGFMDGFLLPNGDEINGASITRAEIQYALRNPRIRFIPILFRGFSWSEEQIDLFHRIFEGDCEKFLTALQMHYDPVLPMALINKICDKIRPEERAPQMPNPIALPNGGHGHALILDGLQENLIEATKKHLEYNYHLWLNRAEMDVFIEDEDFRICYTYGGKILRERRDRIRGLFFNIVTQTNDPNDCLTNYGYDLLRDSEKRQPYPFQPIILTGMARKMYLPMPSATKGKDFLVEIHAKTKNAITPLYGVSKFIFRLPFKRKMLTSGIPDTYRFSLHFNTCPKWVKCYRVNQKGKAEFLDYLTLRKESTSGYYSFDEPYAPDPVGTIRVYTFER